MDIQRQIGYKLQSKYKQLSEAELQEKLQEEYQKQVQVVKNLHKSLKSVLKSGQYIKNPRGRSRKGKIFEYAVKPSTIKKRHKTLAARISKYITNPRILNVVDEYKQNLDKVLKKHPKYKTSSEFQQNVADLTTFRFRKFTKKERELIGDTILPSTFFGKRITADVDINLYNIEQSDKLERNTYTFDVKNFATSMIYGRTRAFNILKDKVISAVSQDLQKNNKRYGFYVFINTYCHYTKETNGDETDVYLYKGSKEHRREEAYVSNQKEMKKVFDLCFNEIRIRIETAEGTGSGLRFESIEKVYVHLFRYHIWRLGGK
jgi:predicted nucleotidyltransferase